MEMKSVLSKLLVSQSGEQDRRTPLDVFEDLDKEFNFDLDPCTSLSNYFTKEDNGLNKEWKEYKSVFINPPFKDMSKWVNKILYELSNGKKVIVLLAPAKTETRWFHKLINSKYLIELRFQKGRLTFGEHSNPFIIGICYFILKGDFA
jgi:site-specific DNA-methyltransferase (adenine-specific)